MQRIVNKFPGTIYLQAAIICGAALGGLYACTPREPAVIEQAEQPPPADEAHATSNPLDLSRENIETIVAETIDAPLKKTAPALPDLFSESAQEKRLSVSGRVLTKDEAVSLIDSVEGAEVKLELKTQ